MGNSINANGSDQKDNLMARTRNAVRLAMLFAIMVNVILSQNYG